MWEALRSGSWLTGERARVYSAMIGLFGLAGLIFLWSTGSGLTDRLGRPIGTDFSGIYTSGLMVLSGDPLGPFDPARHVAFQQAFYGNPDIDVFGWHYPPFFLALAAALAALPYVPALLIWQGTTLAMMVATLRAIAPAHPAVLLAILGFPAVIVTLGHGHNAFLTAFLLGTGLYLLPRRPILAGLCIGLLAYKPQFGLVLPLVLALGGHWRAFVAAGMTVAAMVLASTLAFGPEVWLAFKAGAVFTREVILEQGATGWYKIQSAFSAVRSLGGPVALAYLVQGVVTLTCLAGLALMIRVKADARLIAAATAVAAILATPYSLDYDMTILGVAIAFMAAHGVEKGFAPFEKSLLALLWVTPLLARPVMMGTGLPLGFLVTTAAFSFIAWRALAAHRPAKALSWTPSHG